MANAKYIKTKKNLLIVFSHIQQHSEFKHYDPISAGFISFGIDENRNPSVKCHGESVSLNLKSDEIDSELARKQILGWEY